MTQIGIDAVGISVPHAYLDLADLAQARGVPPSKYVEGLGVRRMAIAAPWEDAVALAANASRRLFATTGADPGQVGLCVVGTETAVDHSKPIAAWLHRLVGLPQRARSYEAKHACFGGTAGLLTAMDWIASGSARGRTALVVCTDIARYPLRSAGEPTQGAGAVALLISAKPRLLALEPGLSGSYTSEVDDFWRPLHRKDAVVDGHHSVVNADDDARKIRVREDCNWNGEGKIRADEHEADDQKQNGTREPLEPGRIALAGRTHYARRIRRKVHAGLILILGIGFRGIPGLIRFGGCVSRLFFRRGRCFDLDLRVIR